MRAYGAEFVLTPKAGGMEMARDVAEQMQRDGKGVILDQFSNPDNPRAHYETTGQKFGATLAGRSRILSAVWELLARSWVPDAFYVHKTPRP